jgi:epoxyqueuosine reductase QueG
MVDWERKTAVALGNALDPSDGRATASAIRPPDDQMHRAHIDWQLGIALAPGSLQKDGA